MRTFVDAKGQTWGLSVHVGSIHRVRDLVGVNLLEVVEGKLLERLASDPETLVNVIYALCKPEADKQNISDVQFGESLVGDAIDGATKALYEALTDFFPSRQRQLMAKALAKTNQWQDRALAKGLEMLDSPELDAKLEKLLNSSSTSLLGSSESTPPPSH
jgi:hypothetical protein